MEAMNTEIIVHNTESILTDIENPFEEQMYSNLIDLTTSEEIITPPSAEHTTNIDESIEESIEESESTIQFSLNYGESTISTPSSSIVNGSKEETLIYFTPPLGSQIAALDDLFYTPEILIYTEEKCAQVQDDFKNWVKLHDCFSDSTDECHVIVGGIIQQLGLENINNPEKILKHLTMKILKQRVKGVRAVRYLRSTSLFLDFLHARYPEIFLKREEYYEIITRISR